MELDSFIQALENLSAFEITSTASAVDAAAASAAGEVAWWRATVEIEQLLRERRCARRATVAACRAANAVRRAGARTGCGEAEVTVVARAAAEVARGLVAGGYAQVGALAEVWPRQVALAA